MFPAVDEPEFITVVSSHLLPFFGIVETSVDDGIGNRNEVPRHRFEAGVLIEFGSMPIVEFFNVGDGVEEAVGPKDEGVFGEQSIGDDAAAVILCFEVRIRETEEHPGQLGLADHVR